jgi:nucleoside-diphosphate-sugar epimerase
MGPRIFITGATGQLILLFTIIHLIFCRYSGYIGGHQLAPLQKMHPEYHLVALVRDESQAKVIKTAYPTIETVIGDLDSDQVLQAEAAKADVVLSKFFIFFV